MGRKISGRLILFFVFILIACAVAFIAWEPLRYVLALAIFALALLYTAFVALPGNNWMVKAADILEQCAGIITKYTNASIIPTAITETDGRIRWHNPAFISFADAVLEGKNIYKLYPDLNRPNKDKQIDIQGKKYKKEITQVQYEGKGYLLVRFIDPDSAIKTVNAHKALLGVTCYIEVDNYYELMCGTAQVEHSQIDAQVDKLVSDWADKSQAMLLKYEKDKYLVSFERRHLNTIQNEKFDLLDAVRNITTSTGLNPTLSIAVGAGDSPAQSNIFALKALELAHGRGGDQAVIKDGQGYVFYGGIQKAVEVQTRVRSRTASKALRNLMEQCENIIIMGHDVPDLDCMGAALGLTACARLLNIPVHIVLERTNATNEALVSELRRRNEYKDLIVTPNEAHLQMSKKSMLIIVDTQIGDMTIAPGLIGRSEILVVIDHHLRGTRSIEGATLFYHEPYASSTSEMITEIVQYFSDRIKLRPLEAEALLAGITIDTKGFSYRTGVRTFEAASYLRKAGANTTSIKQLFQDDLQTFSARAEVVRQAQVLKGGIAISICGEDVKCPRLLVAQAADALVGIRGITASFVLCQIDGEVIVSGRSAGTINVQMVLEELGGGGHATIAGAQIKGKNIEQVKEMIIRCVQKYMKEGNI